MTRPVEEIVNCLLMSVNNTAGCLWHSYPEQPDPNKKIILFTDSLNYDIAYYQSIGPGCRFLYFEDILLPDMVKALHDREEEIDKEFS